MSSNVPGGQAGFNDPTQERCLAHLSRHAHNASCLQHGPADYDPLVRLELVPEWAIHLQPEVGLCKGRAEQAGKRCRGGSGGEDCTGMGV